MVSCHGPIRYRWPACGLALLVVAGAVTCRAQPAAGGDPLDLPALLDLVATGSRDAAVATADLAAAEAAVRRAQAGWWPSLDLQAQYLVRDNPIEAQAGTLSFPTAEKASGHYEVSARQLLYDGGRRAGALTAAERQADAARSGGAAAVQQAQLDAMDAYLTAIELAGRGRVLGQRLAALSAHQSVVADLFEHGLTARNDVLETEMRVREVQDQIQAVANHRQVAERDLNRRLGRDPAAGIVLPDSLPTPPPLPADRDAFLAAAPAANAAVRAAADRAAAARAAVALARRLWLPSVFAGAAHAWQENQYLVHPFTNTLLAGMTWNIFDGGARAADVQQAEARAAAAQSDQVEVERTVAVVLDAAWLAWDQARREEDTALANVGAALENLRIVEDQYRGGIARSSDVLDAEALLAASRFDVVMRYYATYRVQGRLLVAAGHDLVAFYRGAPGAARER
jgi:outer membrane protein